MTNYSGLWDGHYGSPYASLGVNTAEQNHGENMHLAKLLKARGNRPLARLMYTLMGVAAGQTASESVKRIPHATNPRTDPTAFAGNRTPQSESIINRVTTSADQTLIRGLLTQEFAPASYPVDKSGNGGGSKLGKF